MMETPGLQRPGDWHRPLWISRRTPVRLVTRATPPARWRQL